MGIKRKYEQIIEEIHEEYEERGGKNRKDGRREGIGRKEKKKREEDGKEGRNRR